MRERHEFLGFAERARKVFRTRCAAFLGGAAIGGVLGMAAERGRQYRERIAQLEGENETLREENEIEPLSHVYNRKTFISKFNEALERLTPKDRESREGDPEGLVLLVFDGDKFKEINDQYGHPAGDKVITIIGEALHLVRHQEDIPGRLGGDEFLLGLPIQRADEAEYVIETVIARLQGEINRGLNGDWPQSLSGHEANLPDKFSLTCGRAVARRGEEVTFEEMYEQADADLLARKQQRGTAR